MDPERCKIEYGKRLLSLFQGSMTVKEYYQEMMSLLHLLDTEGNDFATMYRFYKGLRWEIKDKVDVDSLDDISQLLKEAICVERDLKGKEQGFRIGTPKRNASTRDQSNFESVGNAQMSSRSELDDILKKMEELVARYESSSKEKAYSMEKEKGSETIIKSNVTLESHSVICECREGEEEEQKEEFKEVKKKNASRDKDYLSPLLKLEQDVKDNSKGSNSFNSNEETLNIVDNETNLLPMSLNVSRELEKEQAKDVSIIEEKLKEAQPKRERSEDALDGEYLHLVCEDDISFPLDDCLVDYVDSFEACVDNYVDDSCDDCVNDVLPTLPTLHVYMDPYWEYISSKHESNFCLHELESYLGLCRKHVYLENPSNIWKSCGDNFLKKLGAGYKIPVLYGLGSCSYFLNQIISGTRLSDLTPTPIL